MASMSYGWASTHNGTAGVYRDEATVELRCREDATSADSSPAEVTLILGIAGLERLHELLGRALEDAKRSSRE